MAGVSQFSTPENYQTLQENLQKIDHAMNEAQLAVQARIPNAEGMLQAAQETKKRIEQVLHTYFPSGAVPSKD